mmetsp:Transcript_80024/g.138905  ORF Transcript_80024/g.138905 Transcript_80024/m.138905 type:complete len:225 (-) Transcript_80024:53-727(-)
MVDLDAPTYVYGPPPDPDKIEDHFIGISSRTFNRVRAEVAYRKRILDEQRLKVNNEAAARRMEHDNVPSDIFGKTVDNLPGSRSLASTYSRMGWTECPFTRRVIAPQKPGDLEPEPVLTLPPRCFKRGYSESDLGSARGKRGYAESDRAVSRGSSRLSARPGGRSEKRNIAALTAAKEGMASTTSPKVAFPSPLTQTEHQRHTLMIRGMYSQYLPVKRTELTFL